jgi:hypothetical protein
MASSSGSWILPVGVAAVLGFGALWAISQAKREEAAAAAEASRPEPPRPFEDMPPEEPPEHLREGPFAASPKLPPAPEGLADTELWIEALDLAAQAEPYYVAATDAHAAGDRDKLNEQGKKARALFDRALENTAEWEEELIAAHGETDSQVRAVKRRRSLWFDRTRWLHKSIAR